MTVETVENLEDVGSEGGDAREGRCAFVGKKRCVGRCIRGNTR